MSKILVDDYFAESATTAASGSEIVRLAFSTEDISPTEQYDYWQSLLSELTSEIALCPGKNFSAKTGFNSSAVILATKALVMTVGYSDYLQYSCSISADKDSDSIGLVVMLPLDNRSLNINAYARVNELPIAPGMIYLADDRHADISQVYPGRLFTLRLTLQRDDYIAGNEPFPDPFAMTIALQQHPLCDYLRQKMVSLSCLHGKLSAQTLSVMLDNIQNLLDTVIRDVISDLLPRPYRHNQEGSYYDRIFYLAEQYILANLHLTLDAQTIGEGIACSRSTLYRAFAQQAITLNQFITNKRMQRLHALLALPANRSLTLGKIIQYVGYHDLAYTGRLFKNAYQMSMSDWRKLNHL